MMIENREPFTQITPKRQNKPLYLDEYDTLLSTPNSQKQYGGSNPSACQASTEDHSNQKNTPPQMYLPTPPRNYNHQEQFDNNTYSDVAQNRTQEQCAPNSTEKTSKQAVYFSKDGKPLKKDRTNLIVNFLPANLDEQVLKELFEQCGKVDSCKIVRCRQTCQSKGYGFVKFTNVEAAAEAVRTLNKFSICGKKLKVAIARPNCKSIQRSNIHIGGLPKHYTDNDLRTLFREYGELIECRVLTDKNKSSKCSGFVRLDTFNNANRAIQALNGTVPPAGHSPITLKLAYKNNERVAVLNRAWERRVLEAAPTFEENLNIGVHCDQFPPPVEEQFSLPLDMESMPFYPQFGTFGYPYGYLQNPMYTYPTPDLLQLDDLKNHESDGQPQPYNGFRPGVTDFTDFVDLSLPGTIPGMHQGPAMIGSNGINGMDATCTNDDSIWRHMANGMPSGLFFNEPESIPFQSDMFSMHSDGMLPLCQNIVDPMYPPPTPSGPDLTPIACGVSNDMFIPTTIPEENAYEDVFERTIFDAALPTLAHYL